MEIGVKHIYNRIMPRSEACILAVPYDLYGGEIALNDIGSPVGRGVVGYIYVKVSAFGMFKHGAYGFEDIVPVVIGHYA